MLCGTIYNQGSITSVDLPVITDCACKIDNFFLCHSRLLDSDTFFCPGCFFPIMFTHYFNITRYIPHLI